MEESDHLKFLMEDLDHLKLTEVELQHSSVVVKLSMLEEAQLSLLAAAKINTLVVESEILKLSQVELNT